VKRILFIAEAVTLAQVVRLRVLAAGLDPQRYQVHFAAAHFDELIFAGTTFRRWPIHSLSARRIDARVRGGRRLYHTGELRRYLDADRRLIDAVTPDVVVSDLRLSLAVECPVPHAALINAYWLRRDGWPLPDHPIVSLLGERRAARHFPAAIPRVFAHFAAPINRLRAERGCPPLTLPEILTHGDAALFPDTPELCPGGPPRSYLGPVLWAPRVPRPSWWHTLDRHRHTAYVTLGSSGRADLLPRIVEALPGWQLLIATAGRADPGPLPAHAHAADFLDGGEAAARAQLVVSNGGSTTGYQALAAGTPVLGVASNLDQHLAMTAITRIGAGRVVPARGASVDSLRRAAEDILEQPGYARAARAQALAFRAWDPHRRFAAALEALASPRFVPTLNDHDHSRVEPPRASGAGGDPPGAPPAE
jgi:UDP:flavonoid glycosyltransferase YjiC (YdhE family)